MCKAGCYGWWWCGCSVFIRWNEVWWKYAQQLKADCVVSAGWRLLHRVWLIEAWGPEEGVCGHRDDEGWVGWVRRPKGTLTGSDCCLSPEITRKSARGGQNTPWPPNPHPPHHHHTLSHTPTPPPVTLLYYWPLEPPVISVTVTPVKEVPWRSALSVCHDSRRVDFEQRLYVASEEGRCSEEA